MILNYWKNPLCTVRTRPTMDAVEKNYCRNWPSAENFYMRSKVYFFLLCCSLACKNEITKKTVTALLLWVTGGKGTGFLRDDKWRGQFHNRDTLLTLVSSTDGSRCCEGNVTLVRKGSVLSSPFSGPPPEPGAGGASRGSRQHTERGWLGQRWQTGSAARPGSGRAKLA